MTREVYLDHQAATPLLPEVLEAMRPYFSDAYGSASSIHQHGLRARDALARAREQIAAFVNAESPEEIIFTSDGTEAANLAVKGTAWASQRRGRHLVTSEIEHPAVLGSVEFLESQQFTSTRIKVDSEGFIQPEPLRSALTDQTVLLALHHANHDVGTIQRVPELAALAAERGAAFYVDAEASAGWLPIDVRAMGVDLLSFSPHRFYGPKGVGVLYRQRRARLTSLIHGGVQEGGRRAGTENIPAIVGAGVAAEIAQREQSHRMAHTTRLQARLWEGLQAAVPYLKLNGPPPGPRRLSTQLNLSAEFVEGEGLLLLLDTRGVAIASGMSCVSKALKVSPVLTAIGLDHSLGQAAVLLSLGQNTTEADVDYVLEVFPAAVAKLRGMSPTWEEFERGQLDSVVAPRRGG
ncbi:MAG TPA: cysteine desulfurase family protein [Candidatus Saccharimonadales bacterium]|nr:cysteine desulfurase family protein [Candidatus Saccharimonadales bacterium]